MSDLDRRQALKLLGALGAAGAAGPLLAACGSPGTSSGAAAASPVKIGLVLPQTGSNKSIGDDLFAGFRLYLTLNGNLLGGHPVELVIADEGETAESGKAAVEKLLTDKVTALSGVASLAVMNAVKDTIEAVQVPLIGSHASPRELQGARYVWRTSYVSDEPGRALGRYLAERVGGLVYVLAEDVPSSRDAVTGFLDTYTGKNSLDPVYTAAGATSFATQLNQIRDIDPDVLFCGYSGASAVAFLQQFRDQITDLKNPLVYGPGFLTEGALTTEGATATNVFTSTNYTADLDNATNRRFVREYTAAYRTIPTTYAVASYDAAAVLDKAIRIAGRTMTPQSLGGALERVGNIDSPRGGWLFNKNKTPLQKWYLRQVRPDGSALSNGLVSDLVTLGWLSASPPL